MKISNESAIREAIHTIYDADRVLDLRSLTTPINLDEQRNLWRCHALGAASMNLAVSATPAFKYCTEALHVAVEQHSKLNVAQRTIEHNLTSENDQDRIIMAILRRRIEEMQLVSAIAASMLNRDDQLTSRLSAQLFGTIDTFMVLEAYEYLNGQRGKSTGKGSLGKTEITRQQARDKMTEVLDKTYQFPADLSNLRALACAEVAKTRTWPVREFHDFEDNLENMRDGAIRVACPTKKPTTVRDLSLAITTRADCHIRYYLNSLQFANELLEQTPFFLPILNLFAASRDEHFFIGAMNNARINDQVATRGYSDVRTHMMAYTAALDQARRGNINFAKVAAIIMQFAEKQRYNTNKAIDLAWDVAVETYRGCIDLDAYGSYHFTMAASQHRGMQEAQTDYPDLADFAMLCPLDFDILRNAPVIPAPAYPNKNAASNMVKRFARNS